jgi:twitching motility two-component system response regulator PilH
MSFLDRLRTLIDERRAIREAANAAADTARAEIAARQPQPPRRSERRDDQRKHAQEGTRVLVIDDSATILAALGRMLRQNHYDVLDASDAERGLQLAKAHEPAIIFLDIVMPGMSGFEALRQLRRDPQTSSIPIIMMSGNELATEQFYVQRIGADDFMKKPFSRGEVFSRIARLLDEEGLVRRHERA